MVGRVVGDVVGRGVGRVVGRGVGRVVGRGVGCVVGREVGRVVGRGVVIVGGGVTGHDDGNCGAIGNEGLAAIEKNQVIYCYTATLC